MLEPNTKNVKVKDLLVVSAFDFTEIQATELANKTKCFVVRLPSKELRIETLSKAQVKEIYDRM